MRVHLLALYACAYVASAYSQQVAPVAVGAEQGTNSPPQWSATNTGATTIIAFAFTYDLPTTPVSRVGHATATRIYDAATEPLTAKPIPPGSSVRLPWSPPGAGQITPQIRAVVLSDGASWGGPSWVQRILQRRGYMERSLRASINELSGALISGASRGQLLEQFQSSLAAERAGAADSDERACIESVRGVVIKNLLQVNYTKDGTPITAADIIQHEVASLGQRLLAVMNPRGWQ